MLFIPVILGKMAVVVGIAAVVVEALVVVVSVSDRSIVKQRQLIELHSGAAQLQEQLQSPSWKKKTKPTPLSTISL